jgi:renalase
VGEPDYVAGHRWRYARVERPLGQPFVANGVGTLLAGGDWALGSLASDAVASGRAMARRVLENIRG